MKFNSEYVYFKDSDSRRHVGASLREKALRLSHARLNPRLTDPDYLLLRARRRLFSGWLNGLGGRLRVLDVGGRIQPYRPLVEDRLEHYIAVDPQLAGLVDAVAVGERLPFADNSFDLVICTQVLSYVKYPDKVVAEIYRVLKRGGLLFVSAPAFFPWHHDERWRFLPDGLRILLSRFSRVEVAPEGYSVAGWCRTCNVLLNIWIQNAILRRIVEATLIPTMNLFGATLDRFSRGNEQFTANNSAVARK